MTAWITGSGGLIGNYLVQTVPRWAPGWNVIGLNRAALDLTDVAAVRKAFREQPPGLILHCAALTKSVACQKDRRLAWQVNVEATARLADLAANIPLILFSTDLVFDGRQGNYDESASVSPLTVYGESKAAAEKVVLSNPRHTVVRASLNFGISPTGDRSFNEELRRLCVARQALRLFTDEFRCPIMAEVTARAVWELVHKNQPGLYHLAGAERLSRWEIGQLLAARWPALQPRFEPGSLRDYQGPPRSPDTSLNCAKVQALLSFPLPRLSEWLAAHPEAAL
jgi:dTDP-4-dehydrorhamnose reductase